MKEVEADDDDDDFTFPGRTENASTEVGSIIDKVAKAVKRLSNFIFCVFC